MLIMSLCYKQQCNSLQEIMDYKTIPRQIRQCIFFLTLAKINLEHFQVFLR